MEPESPRRPNRLRCLRVGLSWKCSGAGWEPRGFAGGQQPRPAPPGAPGQDPPQPCPNSAHPPDPSAAAAAAPSLASGFASQEVPGNPMESHEIPCSDSTPSQCNPMQFPCNPIRSHGITPCDPVTGVQSQCDPMQSSRAIPCNPIKSQCKPSAIPM